MATQGGLSIDNHTRVKRIQKDAGGEPLRVVQRLDEVLWSQFVNNSMQGNVFLTPEMFRVFAGTNGHQPNLLAAVDNDGQPLALLLTVEIALFPGPLRYFSTRAIAYGGLLSAPGPKGQKALEALLYLYRRRMKDGCLFTELRNQCDYSCLQPMLHDQGFAFQPHLNHLIDLNPDEATLWANVSKSAQQRVHSAQHKGVVVEEVNGSGEQLEAAYALLQDVYKRAMVPLASRSLFNAAADILAPKGMLKIIMARLGDRYIGVRLLLIHGKTVVDWYAATDRVFASYSPGELLVWHTLQWAKENDFQLFDFGGAGRPDRDYGPREFKSKFGGTMVNYGRNVCVHAPIRLALSQAGYRLLRKFL